MKTHKDLDVWKKSMSLVGQVYLLTRDFPKEEVYGLTNQIRKSAVSIPSNIAEGSARQGNKEFIHFLYIALGSFAELETQLMLANQLGYLADKEFDELLELVNEVGKMINGLIKYRKSRH